MTEYQILKLLSGEEIICDVVSKEHPRTFEIKAPHSLKIGAADDCRTPAFLLSTIQAAQRD